MWASVKASEVTVYPTERGGSAVPLVAGLLLAAGAGRRYGGPKALAVLADGTPFLRRAVTALREGGCRPVTVVLGAGAEQARALAAGADVVVNRGWAVGMGSSLVVGLAALPAEAEAALVLLVDTPGVGAAAISRLVAVSTPDAVVVATYSGRRGHPVLIGRRHWAEVARLAVGDVGARPFLRAHPELVSEVACEDVASPEDVDTPADLPD